ncbi:MAG: DUF1634 domain-containing protein [Bacteroidota bacterium]|nr:DUF1634 domain-containing protein [Bacteroidota bacterium]
MSLTLRVGIVVSGVMMLAGFVLYAAQPVWYDMPVPALTLSWLDTLFDGSVLDVLRNPYLYLYAGLFALMLTPILRLLVTGYTFWRDGDMRYVRITIAVLVIIGLSIVFSVTH